MAEPHDPTRVQDTVRGPESLRAGRERDPLEWVGPLAVVGRLGAGGMGEVLEVEDDQLRRRLAAKVIRGQGDAVMRAKFRREAQLTGALEHPNIVPVHGFGEASDGQQYFTMKRVVGQDLAAVVAAERAAGAALDAASLSRTLSVFVKVCHAIDFAHSRGVVHRDLKPANVMVGEFGEVLVMDWGLARALGDADVNPEADRGAALDLSEAEEEGTLRTLDGTVVGTPAYMPPEQAEGQVAEIDERSDVYALGAMLYELLTHAPPYEGKTAWAVLSAVSDGPPTPPLERAPARGIPAELDAVVRKAMAHEKSERYASVRELVDDLEAFRAGRLVGAAQYTRRERLARFVRRHRAALALVAAVVVTAAIVGAREPLRRARLLAEARAELAARNAREMAVVERLARSAPAALRERRLAPSIVQRQRLGAAIRTLQARAAAQQAVLALAPGDEEARVGLRRTLLLTAEIAGLAAEDALAENALSRAGGLGDDAAVTAAAKTLAKRRDAERRRRREVVEGLLERATRGELDESDYLAAVAVISSFRDAQTARTLVDWLDAVSTAMRRTTLEVLAATGTPTEAEATRGWAVIADLPQALAAWDARYRLPGEPLAPALSRKDHQRVDSAKLRLRMRARGTKRGSVDHRRQRLLTWQSLAAEAQIAVIPGGASGVQAIRLVCDSLALIGARRAATEALGRYLLAEQSDLRAITAGLALARLARSGEARAGAILDSLVGLSGEHPPRWHVGTAWYAQARDRYTARPDEALGGSVVQLLQRAQQLVSAGHIDEALRLFARVLEADPRAFEAYVGRAHCYRRRKEFDKARAAAESAQKLAPGSADVLVVRAAIEMDAGRLEEANALGARALEIEPANLGALQALATIARHRRRYAEAQGHLDRLLEMMPRNVAALKLRAAVKMRRQLWRAALVDLERVIRVSPGDGKALRDRGRCRAELGDGDGALADLGRAIQRMPKNALSLTYRGEVLARLGSYDAARRDLERAAELEPDRPEPRLGLADLAQRRGDARAAIAATTAILRDFPDWPDRWRALFLRANSTATLGRPREALRDYDAALAAQSGAPMLWQMRGVARYQLGQLDGALRDYDRANRIRPSALTHFHIGLVHLARRDFEEAIASCTRALELDPRLARAYHNRGNAHLSLRAYDKARADYDRAIALDETDGDALYSRANLRQFRDDLPGAREDIDASLERAITPHGLELRAMIRMDSKDPAGAIVDARESIRRDPRRWRARVTLARALASQGKRPEAVAVLREAIPLAPLGSRPGLQRMLARLEGR